MSEYGMVKICKKHGNLTLDGLIKSGKNSSGTSKYRCKKCMKEIHHENFKKNKQKIRIKTQEWRKNNIEKNRELRKKYYHATKEIYKESKNKRDYEYYIKSRDELNDRYVKHVITKRTNLKYADIPDELVKLKRVLLKAQRKLKEQSRIKLEGKINEDKKC